MATADQQNALKDAMERAKQIAAKLQQQKKESTSTESTADESRKRGLRGLMDPTVEPDAKRNIPGGNHIDTKSIVQQVANNLVQRAGFGFQLIEEVNIPNKLVGLVIGRGGEMINKLQSESGAKVQVAPDPTPELAGVTVERKITISGSSESVEKAKALIDEIRNGQKIPERLMVGTLPGEFSIEMNIAKRKVGLVIGKGGETIKSLQERAGCKMVLFQDGPYADTPEKPLRISGEQSTVMYGKQLVQDLLTSKELEGITTQRENYKEIEVPKESIGLIIGAKGANIQQIQQETGCRLQFKNDMEGTTKTAMLTGNPQQLAAAEAKITEIINSNMGSRGRKLNWMPAEDSQVNGSGTSAGQIEVIIEVPANKCGLVIGKGGETIKFIHDESKVNIEINRDIQDASPVRVFEVRGTQEMIDKALEIIREKTSDHTIVARPAHGNEAPQYQDQWGSQANGTMTPPQQQDNQWGQQHLQQQQPQQQQQKQWPEHPHQQQQHEQYQPEQQAPWNQHSHDRPPSEQQRSWNQQPQREPDRDQPRAPWEPQQQQQQWNRPHEPQDQRDEPHQTSQSQQKPSQEDDSVSNRNTADDGVHSGAPESQSQPDYSAAWAEYYEKQRQQQQQHGHHEHGQQQHDHQQHGHQQHHGHQQTGQQQTGQQQTGQQQTGQQQAGQQQTGHQQHGQQQHGQQQYAQHQHEHQQYGQQQQQQHQHEQKQHGQEQHGRQEHEHQQHEQQQHGRQEHEHQQHGQQQHAHQQHRHQEQEHQQCAHQQHVHQEHGHQQHEHQQHAHQQHVHQQQAHQQHAHHQQHAQQQQAQQQHSQYYQHETQQRGSGSRSPGTPPSSTYNPQSQPMSDHQSKFDDYYKSIGQRPPQ